MSSGKVLNIMCNVPGSIPGPDTSKFKKKNKNNTWKLNIKKMKNTKKNIKMQQNYIKMQSKNIKTDE